MPTHARTPQPPLLPTPPSETASASAHRRQRTFSSSSSSSSTSSSSLSTASSAASLPSPSPRGRGAAASRSTTTGTTSVPFSWEHHPGIPKTRFPRADAASPPTAPLPLPPPLRAPPSAARRGHRRRAIPPCSAIATADPFAAALAECTRERSSSGSDAGLLDSLFPASPAPPSRRWSIAAAGGGFLDLYGCKNAMVVAEGAFILRRPVAVARPGNGRAGQGRAGRR